MSLATRYRNHHWTGKVSFHLRFVEEQRRKVKEREWRADQMEIWDDTTACTIFHSSFVVLLYRYRVINDYRSQDRVTQHNQLGHILKRQTPDSSTTSVTEEDLDIFDLGGP